MSRAERAAPRPQFRDAWADLMAGGTAGRLLAVVFLGTLAFNMQDVLLEPYGGEVLGLSVAATTVLTAVWAMGALAGFAIAGRALLRGANTYRMAGNGLLIGLAAFATVIFAAPMQAPTLFFCGAALIGLGAGLFAVSTLTAAMTLAAGGTAGNGLALGAWGAAQATAAGLAIAIGGGVRDLVNHLALSGTWGEALATPATGYSTVYHIEIAFLFVTLVILGPLVRHGVQGGRGAPGQGRLGLADFPT
jgi:BCD family chlorophyll transporter-like MFS transporter